MKKLFFFLIITFFLSSCGNKPSAESDITSESHNSNLDSLSDSTEITMPAMVDKEPDSIEKAKQFSIGQKPDTNIRIQVPESFNPGNKMLNQGLPFGCSMLISHKFPKSWEIDAYSRLDSMLPHEKEFEIVNQYFNKINDGPLTSCPPVKKIEYVLGIDEVCKCNDSLSDLYGRFKLPNFGPYLCYYIYNPGRSVSYCGDNCMGYGNLMLYDSISQNAKLLNIYTETSGDQHVSYRYFYIDKNKAIQVFVGSCYDSGCSLFNKYSIKVLENGQILVKTNR